MKMSVEERFWSKVDKDGPVPPHCPELGPCWVWTAGKDECGYGVIRVGPRGMKAHRLSLALAGNPPPSGKEACHKCDNPGCVNPAHLFIGTHLENMRDCHAKGRNAVLRGDDSPSRRHPERLARGDRHGARLHPERLCRGDAHWTRQRPERRFFGDDNPRRKHPETCPRGESHGSAKLTESQVLEIRASYAEGSRQVDLAKRYGVAQTLISAIVRRRVWKHLSPAPMPPASDEQCTPALTP
jgi:hypothetical protein